MTDHPTKQRLREAAVAQFRRQGYHATAIKQIVAEAGAPVASLYHFYPEGKRALGADAIAVSGREFQLLVEAVWDSEVDVVDSIRAVFEGAALTLLATDYADACPIATVALEVASTDPELRVATARVFEAWIASATQRFVVAGIEDAAARDLAHVVIMLIEGGFMLARAARDTEALVAAGRIAVDAVSRAVRRA